LQDLEFRNEFSRRQVDTVTKLDWDAKWDEMIALHDKQTRRAALEEARKVVKQVTIQAVDAEVRWRDKHAHEEREGIAKSQRSECHLRSLGLSIKAALDRLREGREGVEG